METSLTLRWLNIEFSSACNLRCAWCSLDHTKPRTFLSAELLDKALTEVAGDPAFELSRIELHNGGETLLHPQLDELFAVIARHKERLPEINLLTNAVALGPDRRRAILDSGAIDVVRFSIDGGTCEEFERLRAPAKWPKVAANVAAFLEENRLSERPVRTGVIAVLDPDRALSTDWMEPDFQRLFAGVDDLSLRYPHNWDGSETLGIDDRDYRFHADLHRGKTCYFLTKDLVVLADGRVTVCCADLNGRGVLGDLRESTLRELYASPERTRMLELFAEGRKDEIDLCRDCTGYYE